MSPESEALRRLLTAARGAPRESSSETLPVGLAARVLRETGRRKEDWFVTAVPVVRWGLAASLAVPALVAVLSVRQAPVTPPQPDPFRRAASIHATGPQAMMTVSPKSKVLLGMLLIFLAGSVAGALVGSRLTRTAVVERTKIENLNRNIMELLEEKLSLRPDQVSVIEPLVAQACEELELIHRRGAERVEQVIRKYHEMIATKLDAEQLPILKDMERKRREGVPID